MPRLYVYNFWFLFDNYFVLKMKVQNYKKEFISAIFTFY